MTWNNKPTEEVEAISKPEEEVEAISKIVKRKVRSNRIASMFMLSAGLVALSNLANPEFNTGTKNFSIFLVLLHSIMFCNFRRVANKELYCWSAFNGDTEAIEKRIGTEDERKNLPHWESLIVGRLITDIMPPDKRPAIPIWTQIFKDPVRLVEWIISRTCYKLWTFRRTRFFKFVGDKNA